MSKKEKNRVTQKVIKYVQEKMDSAKEMNMFHFLRKPVDKNAGGTSRYRIKAGKNKGKLI